MGGGGRCSSGSEYLALLHTAVAGTMRMGGRRCNRESEYHVALLRTAVTGTDARIPNHMYCVVSSTSRVLAHL